MSGTDWSLLFFCQHSSKIFFGSWRSQFYWVLDPFFSICHLGSSSYFIDAHPNKSSTGLEADSFMKGWKINRFLVFKIHPQGNGILKKSYPQCLRFQIFKIPGAPHNQTIITACKCAGSWQSHLARHLGIITSSTALVSFPPWDGPLGSWTSVSGKVIHIQNIHGKKTSPPPPTNWASNAKVSWNRNRSFFPFSKTSTSPRSSTCDSDATKRALVPLMNLSFWYVSISSVKVQLSS